MKILKSSDDSADKWKLSLENKIFIAFGAKSLTSYEFFQKFLSGLFSACTDDSYTGYYVVSALFSQRTARAGWINSILFITQKSRDDPLMTDQRQSCFQ
jgi:hypothetical protein